MANDLNQCNFIGRLGLDPETRSFPSGDRVCKVRIAVGFSWKSKDTGDKQDRTEWVPVVFNGKLAEIAEKYLRKGQMIFVSGEFRTRKWTDQAGVEKYSTEIRADQMQMLGSRHGMGGPGAAQGGYGDNQGGGYDQQSQGGYDQQGQGGYEAPRRAAAPQQRPPAPAPRPAPAPMAPPPRAASGFDDMDDDIPF